MRLFYILQFPYAFAMACTRISILGLFVRLFFATNLSRLGHIAYFAIGHTAGWLVFTLVGVSTICEPIEYYWDKAVPNGQCSGGKNVNFAIAVWGMALDVLIFALPIPVLWRLRLPFAYKFAVSTIFALGLL